MSHPRVTTRRKLSSNISVQSDTLRNRAGKGAAQSFQTPAQFSAMALKRAVTRSQT